MRIDIKTALTGREVRVLRHLAAGKRALEIGSLLGFSTVHLAQVADHVVAVDPHAGYPYYNPVPTLPIFQHNMERFGVAKRVTTCVGTAQEIMPTLQVKRDFCFIDCTGFYTDTKFCLENSGAAVIACHDFGRAGCSGVNQAVLEFVKRTGRDLTVVDTLAVIQ